MDQLQDLMKWAIPTGVFFTSVILLMIVKKIFFSRLIRWAKDTAIKWDDILVQSLRLPFNLVILVAALSISQYFITIPENISVVFSSAAKLLIILATLYFLDRFFVGLIRVYSSKNVVLDSSKKLITTSIHLIAFSFASLLVLSALGISITPFIASLGIGSMAVALAMQDTLSNAFAGVHIMIDKPIGRGDYIGLDDGREGFVEAVGWRSTRLRLFSNNIVIIPNSKLAGSVITNYEMPEARASVKIDCGVHYDSDLDHVERVVIEEAKKNNEGAFSWDR